MSFDDPGTVTTTRRTSGPPVPASTAGTTTGPALPGPGANTVAPSAVTSDAPADASNASTATAAVATANSNPPASVPSVGSKQQSWPTHPSRYQLLAQIGKGAFATVWKARIRTDEGEVSGNSNDPARPQQTQVEEQDNNDDKGNDAKEALLEVAVKVLNLESTETNLDEIRHEVHAMRLTSHPNLLNMYAAFLSGAELWLVTPLMRKGSSVSCLQLARRYYYCQSRRQSRLQQQQREQQEQQELVTSIVASHSESPPHDSVGKPTAPSTQTPPPLPFPPPPPMQDHILFILRETVLGLKYLHDNHQIHRDVKGGNILLDCDGGVKLGDFGVSRIVQTGGSSLPILGRRASTFVGTPCWMAPEVMQQIQQGYDCSIDIWSLGITALELAMGYAPYAKYPPMKVLIRTIQEDPPSLATYRREHEQQQLRDQHHKPRRSKQQLHVSKAGSSSHGLDPLDSIADHDEDDTPHPSVDSFSRSFELFVDACLQKNPAKRATCADLLHRHLVAESEAVRDERRHRLVEEVLNVVPTVGAVASGGDGRGADALAVGRRRRAGSHAGAAPAIGSTAKQPTPSSTSAVSVPSSSALPTLSAANVVPASAEVAAGDAGGVVEALPQDRPPGTTWVFAEGDGDPDDGRAMSVCPDEERGSGWITSTSENDDVLRALDEFGIRTGGEHYYGRDQQQVQAREQNNLGGAQQQLGDDGAVDEETIRIRSRSAGPPGGDLSVEGGPSQGGGASNEIAVAGRASPPPESYSYAAPGNESHAVDHHHQQQSSTKEGRNSTPPDEDLSAFMDEFEQSTAGEDFRRVEEDPAPP